MNKRSKELVDYGILCGFQLSGVDGVGHWVMEHPNGSRVRVPSSPGDYRGDNNLKGEMRRKSGVMPSRPNSGRYRKGVSKEEFTPATERVESDSARFVRLEREHRALCERIAYLQECGDRDECGVVVRRLLEIEDEQRGMGRKPSLRTFRVELGE